MARSPQIWATDGQIHMTPYKEFISRQEKHFQPRHGHFIKADGRFIKANGHFIKPMAVFIKGRNFRARLGSRT